MNNQTPQNQHQIAEQYGFIGILSEDGISSNGQIKLNIRHAMFEPYFGVGIKCDLFVEKNEHQGNYEISQYGLDLELNEDRFDKIKFYSSPESIFYLRNLGPGYSIDENQKFKSNFFRRLNCGHYSNVEILARNDVRLLKIRDLFAIHQMITEKNQEFAKQNVLEEIKKLVRDME